MLPNPDNKGIQPEPEAESKHARFDENVNIVTFAPNVDVEKTAPRPDRFHYKGKYRWIQRSRKLTGYAVRFQTKYIDQLDWNPILVGFLVVVFLVFGLAFLFSRYFSAFGIYIVQKGLLGPRSS